MTTRAPFLLTVTALVLTACAMALGSPDRVAPTRTITGHATAQTFACALVAQPRAGGGTRLEARLEAREALAASYDLRVRGPGVSIDQGGDLSLAAGQSAVLGEANVSTAASALDARLTVTARGRTVTCPLQGS
jgi:hypothetical protein